VPSSYFAGTVLPTQLIACHDCDLLQREPTLTPGGAACCLRCGATLFRSRPGWLDRALALTLGAIVTFVIANSFPIVGLKINGELIQTTLYGAVRAMYSEGMHLIASLVFFTTIFAPFAEMAAILSLLLPLRVGHVPRNAGPIFRFLLSVRPWGMTEVFLLALLVALVKLAAIATVVPGIALFSFAILMMLVAAAAASLDTHELWSELGVER
jgi:paraquat-inducible protein A